MIISLPVYADQFYKSNILGMMLEPAGSGPSENGGYILQVSIENGIERRTLFNGSNTVFERTLERTAGKQIEKTVKSDETGIIVRENGITVSEKIIKPGKPDELTEYIYEDGKLKHTDYFQDDDKIYRETYNYTVDGRILDLTRNYNEAGEDSSVSFVFNEGRISRYLYSSEKSGSYIKFDKAGAVYSDTFGEEAVNETREYGTLDNGGRFEIIRNMDTLEYKTIVYDGLNRIDSSVYRDSSGQILEEAEWSYSGENVSRLRVRSDLILEVTDYEYDREGFLVREIYKKNGILSRITDFSSDSDYVEKLYKNGVPILKVSYEDGKRTETQQIREQ